MLPRRVSTAADAGRERHGVVPVRAGTPTVRDETGRERYSAIRNQGAVVGLTRAERRLAVQIAAGHSLRQSADRLGITYETARSQLRAVFGKTGTSRQAELVALLARLRADLGDM